MKKTIVLIAVSIITVFAFQGCALFSCGTDETLNLCEQILRNPDSLDSIANNKNISNFSYRSFKYFDSLSQITRYIRENFSNGLFEPKCSIPRKGLLKYEYYGDYYNNPRTNSYQRAYIRFAFINWSGSWKLIGINDYNPDIYNPYPPDHGDMKEK